MNLGEEEVGPDEQRYFERIATIIADEQKRRYAKDVKPMHRDAHAKHHGVVRAEFIVDADLPPELRVGIFAEPRTFDAYIRFSNGEGRLKSDKKADARGMAIKLLGVLGEKLLDEERDATTQDFLMITHHTFFVRTLPDYISLVENATRGTPLRHFFGWNPFAWRLREVRHVKQALKVIANPLTTQYWSTVPFAFGKGLAAKWSARPQASQDAANAEPRGDSYLRDAMAQTLRERDVSFDFMVQLQTDAERMPIEDSTIEWDESVSPYRKVATIRIPKQEFDREEQHVLAENLSFTPWHSIPEHRPLGNMNRTRKHVYETISKLRHAHNGVPRKEPDGSEIPKP